MKYLQMQLQGANQQNLLNQDSELKVLFLTPGCFDKGGISRYNRYQIKALRELIGERNLKVISLLGPDHSSFEDPMQVEWHGSKNFSISKVAFLYRYLLLLLRFKPHYVWIGHVNFSGFAHFMAILVSAKTILNVYGLEVWSGLSRDAAWGLRKVNHVISDCHNTANYLESNKLRQADSVKIIWDCVDLKKFKPEEGKVEHIIKAYGLPSSTNHFIILTLGRIAKEAAHKGYERLLKVFAKVVDRHSNARLVFAGKGNMTGQLKQEAAKLGIGDKVFFTGMVLDDDMAALYTYADVFSLVSDAGKGRGEGIPLTPLEAMACGTPIIVGDQDGSREAIFDDENGYCIDPFDLNKHAECIVELIESKSLLKNKSAKALSYSNALFNYLIFVDKHSEFIRDLK